MRIIKQTIGVVTSISIVLGMFSSMAIPAYAATTGETATQGDYELAYEQSWSSMSWVAGVNCRPNTWGIRTTSNKETYDDMPSEYAGEPVIVADMAYHHNAMLTTTPKLSDNLESAVGAFMSCTGLTGKVDLSNTKLKDIRLMFNGAGVTEVVLPSTLTIIQENSFTNSKLEKIDIPDSVVEIGANAFQNCTNLKDITLSKNITKIGTNALKGVPGPIKVYKDSYATEYCTSNGITFEQLDGWEEPTDLTIIVQGDYKYVYNGCFIRGGHDVYKQTDKNLLGGWACITARVKDKYEDIPDTVNGYPVVSIARAFESNPWITDMPKIPDGVKDISMAFYECKVLTSDSMPDTLDQVIDASSAFRDCPLITKLPNLPNAKDINHIASNCTNLVQVQDFPNAENIDGAFSNCTSLTDVSSFKYGRATSISKLFAGCTNLKTVHPVIDSNINSFNNAFDGCTNLTGELTILGDIPFNNTQDVKYTFKDASTSSDANLKIKSSYGESNKNLIDSLISTKSSTSNISYAGESELVGLIGVTPIDKIFLPGETLSLSDVIYTPKDRITNIKFDIDNADLSVEPDKITFNKLGEFTFKLVGEYNGSKIRSLQVKVKVVHDKQYPDAIFIDSNAELEACVPKAGGTYILSGNVTEIPSGWGSSKAGFSEREKATIIFEDFNIKKLGSNIFRADGSANTPQRNYYPYELIGVPSEIELNSIGEGSLYLFNKARGNCLTVKYTGKSLNTHNIAYYNINNGFECIPIHLKTTEHLQEIYGSTRITYSNIRSIELVEGLKIIGENAFANNRTITDLIIPKSVQSIGKDAFKGMTSPVYVYANTPAEAYCKANSVPYLVKEEIAPTGVSISPSDSDSLSVVPGDTIQFTANVRPTLATDKSVSWDSSDTSIGTIDSNGLFTATGQGTTFITVITNSGGKSAEAIVTVGPTATDITITSSTAITLAKGNTSQIVVSKVPSTAGGKITYESQDTNIATVSSTGLIAAITPGSTTIKVKCGSIEKEIAVTVTTPIDVVSIEAKDIELEVGQTQQITPTVLPEDATDKSVTYASANSETASVTTGGLVEAKAIGNTTITLTSVSTPSITKVINVVIKEKEVSAPVTITLDAPTEPTNESVAITATTTGTIDYIILPNGNQVNSDTFSYNVVKNGTYTFTAVGTGKDRVSESIKIDCIDKTAPTLLLNSTVTSDNTVYSVDAIDLGSGIDYVQLPDASKETVLPTEYTQDTEGEVTFIAADKAGNLTSKSSQRMVVSIPGSNSSTIVAYEGIPTEWTNKSANVRAAAYNPTDGATLAFEGNNLPESSTNPVFDDKLIEKNGTADIKVADGAGNETTVKVKIDKIDKEMPTATHETSANGEIIINAEDSLSGIKQIYTPDGLPVINKNLRTSSDSASFTPQYNGTYRFVIEDNAGNTVNYDVEATGLTDPDEPIVPPAEVNTSESKDIDVIGTVYPESSSIDGLIGIVVPTKLDFIIDGNRDFISGKYTFKNTGDSNLTVNIKSMTPTNGTKAKVVNPSKFADWTTISKADTLSNIGLTLGEVSLHQADTKLVDLSSGSDAILELKGHYGHNWGNVADVVLKYNLTLEIVKNK